MSMMSFTSSVESNAGRKKRSQRAGRRKVNILLFLTEKIGPDVLRYLSQAPDLNSKVVSDCQFEDYEHIENDPEGPHRRANQILGHQLARWADLLFLVADAATVAKMLVGITSDIILNVLRCWDTSKKIILLPELSVDQWKNPLMKRQLSKLQLKWDWVQVLPPALWDIEDVDPVNPPLTDFEQPDLLWDWEGPEEATQAIHAEAQNVLRDSEHDALHHDPSSSHLAKLSATDPAPNKPKLPQEIWTIILDYLGDWELASALGVYTLLPVPYEWEKHIPRPNRPRSLEYTILMAPTPQIRSALAQSSSSATGPSTLSPLATKLIFKFSLTPVLTYLATHQKDIFWTSFAPPLLPHKASVIHPSPKILEWWKTCPAVLKKEYGPEALDGASRAGFVEVLDWWLHSGLQMHYTEKALESASAKGHLDVLEWWKRAAASRRGNNQEELLPHKVGKSLLVAAQSGRADAIRWWDASGIPYTHEDVVARLASTHGHVNVLEVWRELKGSKMIFDNQVLVGATKNGHAAVLEWWKRSGLRVEYKTCDIEEAMEDAVSGGRREGEVREWWGRNGLNLGVGTEEWMKVKTL